MAARRLIGGIAALLLAVALATAASAQNLVTNPDFDSDVMGWTIGAQEFIEISWSASDVDGSPASGSLELNTATDGRAYQCVPIVGGDSYLLSGAVAPLSTAAGTVAFSLELHWNDGPGCSGEFVGAPAELPSPGTPDVWHRLSGTFEAPETAVSAEVRLASDWTLGSGLARFDAIFVPEPPRNPAAGISVLVLALLRRRRVKDCF